MKPGPVPDQVHSTRPGLSDRLLWSSEQAHLRRIPKKGILTGEVTHLQPGISVCGGHDVDPHRQR